jgi:hypothetical protein
MAVTTERVAGSTAIRPFTVETSDAELDRGGHFAAFEQPELLSNELRTAFRSLR